MSESITAGAFIVVQLVFLEGILSLDNAAVLGAMVVPLPDDLPIPWPVWLAVLGQALNRALGPQRTAALRVGLLGAYAGRAFMLVLAAWVMRSHWLILIGALYLIYLAVRNLVGDDEGDPSRPVRLDRGFWQVVIAVELADLAFSLDNVVAATAVSNRLPLVILGVALGILMMRFAAGVFARLVQREPILEKAAYVLVLVLGIELLLEGTLRLQIGDLAKFAISLGILVLAVAYAHLNFLQVLAPLFSAAEKGLRALNLVIGGTMIQRRMLIPAGLGRSYSKVGRLSAIRRKAPDHQTDTPEER
jgi:YkoY family integral membrane protein